MNEICPVSIRQVDEKVAQMNAALAVCSLLFFLVTPYRWFILILAADFFIRGFLDLSYSYYSAASRSILRMFKSKPSMINAGPKIFAAKIGFAFCCMAFLFYLLDFKVLSLVVVALFIFFAVLEASCRFCIACKIYPLIYRK